MNKDSWEILKLGEICEIISGSTPKTNINEYWNGKYNWVTPAELNDELDTIYDTQRKITAKAIKETNLKLLPKGAILLSSRAPIGKVAIAGNDMYSNQGFKNLICSKKIYNRYLFRFLKGKTEYLNSLGRGATFKEISKEIVSNIPIPIPPISLQEQIVKELDTLSDIITKKKEQLAELDKLAQATFYDMFGDPIKNEKNWEIKELKYFGNVLTGNTPSRKKIEYYSEPYIEWIKTDNITESLIISQAKEYLSKEGYKISKSVNKGAILVTCIAGSLKSIGRAALTDREVCFNQQINAIQPSSLVNSIFLYWLIKITKSYIEEKTPGVLKFILSKSKFENLIFIFPPISAQNQFAEKIETIDQQKALINQSLTDAQLLFDYTMDKYFN